MALLLGNISQQENGATFWLSGERMVHSTFESFPSCVREESCDVRQPEIQMKSGGGIKVWLWLISYVGMLGHAISSCRAWNENFSFLDFRISLIGFRQMG
tara:strand:+ start:95 stop:394 length:300 start_codon:yes stop_codon:yes gene_type:complete